MKNKILLVGSGKSDLAAIKATHHANADIVLVDVENKQQMQELKTQSGLQEFPIYPYHLSPAMHETLPENEFICKGKGHQYKEVRTTEGSITRVSWVCQCGRKL